MSDSNDRGADPIVKHLAEGFSTQTKLCNRMWIALLAVVLVVLLPVTPTGENGSVRDIPFLGRVDRSWADQISFLMLAILTIAFCKAQAQAMIGYRAAQQILNDMSEQDSDRGQRQRQMFDLLSNPTFTQVAPLPRLIATRNRTLVWRRFAAFYCLALKAVAIGIQLGLPAVALYMGWQRLQGNDSVESWIFYGASVIGVIAALSLLHIFFEEFRNARATAVRFDKGEV